MVAYETRTWPFLQDLAALRPKKTGETGEKRAFWGQAAPPTLLRKYYIFLRIFFGKRLDELPLDFLYPPLLSILGFRVSVAGQPLF
jgi:hypothetical protein